MRKRLSVGIIGIPIEEGERCYFKKGLTEQLRLGTKRSIKSRSKGIVDISDLGELIDSEYQNSLGQVIPKEVFEKLAQEFKEIVDNFDLILVYGGIHSAAYMLYYIKGRVDRYDIHDDASRSNSIEPESYMWHAVYSSNRIKHFNQVSHHGKRELLETADGRTKIGWPTEMAFGNIFDIDVDYYMHTDGYLLSIDVKDERGRVAGIKQAIRNARPKIIGVFEYQRLDGSNRGYRRILDFAWEGTIARLGKKK